ncbi:toll-like receptor 2 [Pelodytes ibericus]
MFYPNGSSLLLCLLTINLAEGKCYIDMEKRTASCKGQQLNLVPSDLPSELECLDLSYNKLSQIGADDFYAFYNLQILDLSFNNISSIDNDSFTANKHLRKLSLFNNSLTEMPSVVLEPLAKLEVLDMSNNFYNYSTLGEEFRTLVNIRQLSIGGPLISAILEEDFLPIKNIRLKKFAVKTKSSLARYDVGAFSAVNADNMWFDIALDKQAHTLPDILKDLEGKTFNSIRFRNLFEFVYYVGDTDLFSSLENLTVDHLIFYRGKFNENLLRMVLKNVGRSSIHDLSLLSIDFSRSPNANQSDDGIDDLSLDNLVIMDVTNPDILRFDWTFTWFGRVTNLNIINVNFNYVPCDAWSQMSNVQTLNVSGNRLLGKYLLNPSCSSSSLPTIEIFNASNNLLNSLSVISLLTTNWPRLSTIDLRSNLIGTLRESCTWTPNITSLVLRDNLLHVAIFKCLPITVEYLDLSNSQLDSLDMSYFNKANNLHVLILSHNKIKFIPTDWKSMSLQRLALEGNSFGVIEGNSFSNFPNLHNLTAGNNPFHCTCDLYSFITETVSYKRFSLDDWPDHYFCYYPAQLLNTKVEYYRPGDLECDVRLVVAVSVSVTTFVVILCMLLCWKFDIPWYLRATCHIVHSKYRSRKTGEDKAYGYHAFISYSYSDAEWVRGVLLPRLEDSNPPYRVCIHERDFLPGRWIIDNIIENIENSHKIIFVLSRSFVNSEWCNYELYFAHQRAIGHAFDDVILVVKEQVSLQELPKRFYRLRKMLNTKTYLEWPVEQNRQEFFWVQLKSILGRANYISIQDNYSIVNESSVVSIAVL